MNIKYDYASFESARLQSDAGKIILWFGDVSNQLVMTTGAGNDYQKDKQFKKLNAQKDKLEVKVIRDGEQMLVENTEVVVGDLLLLDTGDKIVADGIIAKSFNLVVDEAALTGESEPLNKGDEDVWCMSGSEVRARFSAVMRCMCLASVALNPDPES